MIVIEPTTEMLANCEAIVGATSLCRFKASRDTRFPLGRRMRKHEVALQKGSVESMHTKESQAKLTNLIKFIVKLHGSTQQHR